MDEVPIVTEVDHVRVLTLSRPRSLDSAGKHSITATAEELAERNDLRALIINASHPAAFLVNVAGLSDMQEAAAADFSRAGHRLSEHSGIAFFSGHCGGGRRCPRGRL
jgi:enoyl-CoA hydratase/carnithine racemase